MPSPWESLPPHMAEFSCQKHGSSSCLPPRVPRAQSLSGSKSGFPLARKAAALTIWPVFPDPPKSWSVGWPRFTSSPTSAPTPSPPPCPGKKGWAGGQLEKHFERKITGAHESIFLLSRRRCKSLGLAGPPGFRESDARGHAFCTLLWGPSTFSKAV
ncbi:hypothetical protein GWK47_023460 [Chionoecetes opilio]|uniref:Uncharacterized protein n=1 Tax=Chionoecetes opilio TaxID=41210 RepID=A0A8J5BTZ5_CHIOP|nr:hypothetical protein GWK47_023460 [Chionoecetes opilio]